MGIVLAIVVLVISFIIIPFFRDWKSSDSKIKSEGGLSKKYAILIQIILDSEHRMKVYKRDVSSALIGFSFLGGHCKFFLVHAFNGISIVYTFESNVYGKHKLKWDFDENLNQEKMAEIIFKDMAKMDKQLTI